MKTISKKELGKKMAENLGITSVQGLTYVQYVLTAIVDELAAGNRLEFRGFGVFETRERKKRLARNPKTGDKVEVPPKTVVTFKPGKDMKDRITKAIEVATPE